MKNLLLVFLLSFFSFNGAAQDPDPELFRTWHLYFIQATDLDPEFNISEINPPIHPFITILEDLSFTGGGACNTFNGVYDFYGNNMNAITFNETTDDCGVQVHNSFESSYFGFMHFIWYYISQDSDGLTLYLDSPLMGYAIFKEYPLSVNDHVSKRVKIYPNPVLNTLYISSEKNDIERLNIYSISGQKVLEQHIISNTIDVSNLSNGMYFIEITSSEGKTVKKFIKK